MLRRMATTSSAAAPRAEPVLPGVYRIGCPFGDGGIVHVYYVDAPEPALIDTGVAQSPAEAIEPALAAVGFALSGVRHVFNTHGHWDHMGGNEAVRAVAGSARTYAAAADRYLFDDVENHVRGAANYAARLTGDQQEIERQAAMLRAGVSAPTPVDVLVEDGQVFSLGSGIALRAVATPGHSHGSTSYFLESQQALFTGDGVQGLGSRPGLLPLVFEDSRAYRETIVRLADLPLEALCMGHSFCGLTPASGRDPVRRGAAARTYLEESGEAAKAVEEAMRSTLAANPAAPFLDVARDALALLAEPLGVELDQSGLSIRSLATLHAFYRELTGAPKPS
jgi:glyoxylase-like metal-dependent hydrolase (beta-lactamase superfamily II)